MRIKNIFSLLALSIIVFTYSSCNKKDPIVINEEELITTLTYTLTPTDGSAAVVMTFKDLDGDGGNAPEITGGTLISGMTYDGVITLSNESETPVEDITQEVQTEGVDHQFFFAKTGIQLTTSYEDMDADGRPIGLSTQQVAGAAASGTLTITLRHQPDKAASGVSGGDITNAGGETDIEVTFPVEIQ